MLTFTDDELADKLQTETGERPEWRAHPVGEEEWLSLTQRRYEEPLTCRLRGGSSRPDTPDAEALPPRRPVTPVPTARSGLGFE